MRRAFAAGIAAAAVVVVVFAPSASAKVLRVGSYKGITGQFSSIQAAINAARPGDWILVGPGDYKTTSSRTPAGRPDLASGLIMSKRDVYIRGMNRNTVVVDGTKPGSARCSRKAADQNFGPASSKGPKGLNGILIWKAADVWVQNLTVCNFLGGSADTGNEIWWNGGDGSGKIGGQGYYGSYMTTTSTFYKNETTAAKYGIFSSNWNGGEWDHSYASNFNDSGYYIGACQQACNQTMSDAHAQFNALGYSGSNAGGQLVIKNSEFDHNKDGFDTNSQNGDNPPPQNGACPGNKVSSITHTHSCWVFVHNYVHDNNNPNVPASGSAAAGPLGTGMSVSGARNDTIMNNRFVNNGAWGVIFVPYLDSGKPCTGGTLNGPFGPNSCFFDEYGDALIGNTFVRDGFFGNPTNGGFAQVNLENNHPINCYRGNTGVGGLTPDEVKLQQTYPSCSGALVPAGSSDPAFLNEVLCDTQLLGSPCSKTDHYPRRTQVIMPVLPKNLPTMPKVCAGVPANPWCPTGKH
jgi:hypothetical protein